MQEESKKARIYLIRDILAKELDRHEGLQMQDVLSAFCYMANILAIEMEIKKPHYLSMLSNSWEAMVDHLEEKGKSDGPNV